MKSNEIESINLLEVRVTRTAQKLCANLTFLLAKQTFSFANHFEDHSNHTPTKSVVLSTHGMRDAKKCYKHHNHI